MEVFPENFQWMVWRAFFSKFVLRELIRQLDFIWENPSDQLLRLCSGDAGAIQQGHHELAEMIEDEHMWMYNLCVGGKCLNCEDYGFPCTNLAWHGFRNMHLDCLWKANWV